jgi:hypothetical protein
MHTGMGGRGYNIGPPGKLKKLLIKMPLEPLGRRKIVSPKNKTSKIIIETVFFFAFF